MSGENEHRAWIGCKYDRSKPRVMIVGYSHHGDDPSNLDITRDTARSAAAGHMQVFPFFARMHSYFDQTQSVFWERVVFINFLPTLIGGAGKRYAWGTISQHQAGFQRLRRLIEEHRPTHVLVLTPKPDHQRYAPYRISDLDSSAPATPIDNLKGNRFAMTIGGHPVEVATLPHSQGARSAYVRSAIAAMGIVQH